MFQVGLTKGILVRVGDNPHHTIQTGMITYPGFGTVYYRLGGPRRVVEDSGPLAQRFRPERAGWRILSNLDLSSEPFPLTTHFPRWDCITTLQRSPALPREPESKVCFTIVVHFLIEVALLVDYASGHATQRLSDGENRTPTINPTVLPGDGNSSFCLRA